MTTPSLSPARKTGHRLLTPAAFAVLLALSPEAWSAAGKVLFVSGQTNVNRNGTALVALTRGAELNAGDLIVTGNTGFAQLLMDDGGRVTVRANSQLRLDAFDYDGKPNSKNRSLMSLLSGSMRAITGLIGHQNRDNYKIKTPTATVGIRGSDGNIGYDPAIGASVQTLSGGHTLTSFDSRGFERTLNLNPGDVGLVPPNGGAPVKVENFPFATTQPPQARINNKTTTTTAGSGATAAADVGGGTPQDTASTEIRSGDDIPAPTETTRGINNDTLAALNPITSDQAPSLVDGQGSIPTTDGDGNPVVLNPGEVVIPPPPPPPPIEIGLSERRVGVVSASAVNLTSEGNVAMAQVDDQVLPADRVSLDANNNLLKYYLEHGGLYEGYRYLENGAANPAQPQVSGDLSLGAWTRNSQVPTRLLESYTLDNTGNSGGWAYGQAGYYELDLQNPTAMPMTGIVNYTGQAVGGRSYDGSAFLFNSASLQVDFSQQTVGLMLNVTTGSNTWAASTSGLSLMADGGQSYRNSFHANTYNGSLTIGTTSDAPTEATGTINGSFTGANFSGALLQYDFQQGQAGIDGQDGGVTGGVAYKAGSVVNAPDVVNGPSTVDYVAVSDFGPRGNSGLRVTNLSPSNPLGWSYALSDLQSVDIAFIGGTVDETGNWSNGLHSGTWTDGQLQQTFSTVLDANSGYHWATLLRPQAWYLPGILSGTASYTTQIHTAPVASDGSTWTLNGATTTLAVDFTQQLIDFTVSLNDAAGNTVQASADNAALQGPDGGFSAATNTEGRGGDTLMISRNGVLLGNSEAWGQVNGQLGGTNLGNAILGYGLNLVGGCTATQEVCFPSYTSVAGTVGFVGPGQDENLDFTLTAVALTTSEGAPISTLGFSGTGRYQSDTAGVSGFDIWPDFEQAATLRRGNATVAESGSHGATGLSWGRWSGGADVFDRAGNSVDTVGNVHYLSSQESGPALLPLSGTFNYTVVGHTTPTNESGTTGVLNSATLSADFTHRLVDVTVSATVAGTTLVGDGQNVALFDNAFQASSMGGGTGALTVSCSGTGCGTIHAGAITGHFTGNGALGAGISYALDTVSNSAASSPVATSINGVVAFERTPPAP